MQVDDVILSEKPEQDPKPEFWRVLMRCTQLAAMVVVAFFFLFHLLGSPILAWINILSLTLYTYAYYAMKNRNNKLAIRLIWTEVLIHAALGVILLGWHSGFHYYLLMFIPAICLSAKPRSAYLMLVLLFCCYIGLDLLNWEIGPMQPINDVALKIVNIFNLSVVFVMFSYLSFYYLKTVRLAHNKLHRLATIDPLTGLLNRRQMINLANREILRIDRTKKNMSILLLDVDHFKTINDQFGHNLGDHVLRRVGEILKAHIRAPDLISRWGGEEFLIILPETTPTNSILSAERIRTAFLTYDWFSAVGEKINPTVSIGISKFSPEETLSAAIARADKALYKSKQNGRNQVIHADSNLLKVKPDF